MKPYAALTLLLVLFAAGCGDKNESAEATNTQAGDAGKVIAWTVPDGWTEEPPSNAMRKAQFVLPRVDGDTDDATVVITFFPGDGKVGGNEANIQRWYGQMRQPDGSATADVATTEERKVNGLSHTRVEMTGTYTGGAMMGGHGQPAKTGYKMVSTIVESGQGPYFVKMVGPEATVSKWEESYDAFLASFTEG